MNFTAAELFDLNQTAHAALFDGCNYAWEALKKIEAYLANIPPQNASPRFPGTTIGNRVIIGHDTVIEPGAMIIGPAIIGKNCRIRHNAYLRENVIIGDDCVVGNSSELKNTLLFNGAQVPHFNYVGDSILGHKAHLGAGVKISNVKLFPGNIQVEVQGLKAKGQSLETNAAALETLGFGPRTLDTGLRKFGALLGDGAEAGCNAVLNPGSILGRGAVVYPNVFWRGILPANMIAKNKAEIEVVVKRPRGNLK